jgi:hypothetical protein
VLLNTEDGEKYRINILRTVSSPQLTSGIIHVCFVPLRELACSCQKQSGFLGYCLHVSHLNRGDGLPFLKALSKRVPEPPLPYQMKLSTASQSHPSILKPAMHYMQRDLRAPFHLLSSLRRLDPSQILSAPTTEVETVVLQ